MGLIVELLAGLAAGVASSDIVTSADRVCGTVVHRAALRLAPFEQASREAEWLAHLADCRTAAEKYRHAIGCYLAAPGMRRRALAVTFEISFSVSGVGTVPLTICMTSLPARIAMTAMTSPAIPKFARDATTISVVLTGLLRLLWNAHRIGPRGARELAKQLGDFKNWAPKARMKVRGMELDLSKVASIYIKDPVSGRELLKKLHNALAVEIDRRKQEKESKAPTRP